MRRRVLAVIGASTALLVTTATSPDDEDQVHSPQVVDTTIYVEVAAAYGDEDLRAESTDGGLSWRESPGPDVQAQGVVEGDSEACRSDGWCFRSDREAILERPPGGEWRTAFQLGKNERDMLRYRTSLSPDDLFGSVAVVSTGQQEHVVVTSGEEGVLVLDGDGQWHRVGVLTATPTDLAGLLWPLLVVMKLHWVVIPVALLAVLVRSPGPATGLSAGARLADLIGLLMLSGMLIMVAGGVWLIGGLNRLDPMGIAGAMLVAYAAAIGLPFALTSKNDPGDVRGSSS